MENPQPKIEKRLSSPILREYVKYYLILEIPMAELPYLYSPATHRNIMILRFEDDMVISYKNQKGTRCNEVSLTGLSDRIYHVKSSAKTLKVILTEFTPFGASSLFRLNGQSFFNSNNDLEDFIPSNKKQDLKDRLCSAQSVTEKINYVEQFLIQFLPKSNHAYRLNAVRSCLDIMTEWPEISINDLSKKIKHSQVHLRRLFHQHIGVSPKKYLELNRFNRIFLHTLEGKKIMRHPYFDDPHLIKEFRQFTGFTPTSYPKDLISTEHILESIPVAAG